MCLFPWSDYGIDIVDFEKFDFLVGQPIFTSVRACPAGKNGLSYNNKVSIHDHKIFLWGHMKVVSSIQRVSPYILYICLRGGFAAGPLGLSVEVHVNFDKNLTMLVEKFWNASTERLNQVNAAIDASNFYFNMLEIFQMYFTFPSFKNIATQRSFNEIIHFPLHCLKSTFSFQKSCRKSEKWFWGDLCNCPSEILQKDRKNDFGVFF